MKKVAVYGSLLKSLHNHHILGDSELLGTDKINGFSMYSLGSFPFITPDETDTKVDIEVYEVNASVFSALDRLEGYPSFYDRKEVDTEHGKCWIYFMEDTAGYNTEIKVSDGDWKTFYRSTHSY